MLPEQQKAFNGFYESARQNEILDGKTTVMIHLAAAMAVGCYPCMKHYLAQVADVGVTNEEIDAIEAIVMAVSGGRVMAQLQDARSQDQTCTGGGPCDE